MKITTLALLLAASIVFAQQPAAIPPPPLIKENATVKISEHVYVIPDGSIGGVPNVGIIVGSNATLVVDTGLGIRNGQTVLREVTKINSSNSIYIVATHFHAEHTLGEAAFPATAKVIRPRLSSATWTSLESRRIFPAGLRCIQSWCRMPHTAVRMKSSTTRRCSTSVESGPACNGLVAEHIPTGTRSFL